MTEKSNPENICNMISPHQISIEGNFTSIQHHYKQKFKTTSEKIQTDGEIDDIYGVNSNPEKNKISFYIPTAGIHTGNILQNGKPLTDINRSDKIVLKYQSPFPFNGFDSDLYKALKKLQNKSGNNQADTNGDDPEDDNEVTKLMALIGTLPSGPWGKLPTFSIAGIANSSKIKEKTVIKKKTQINNIHYLLNCQISQSLSFNSFIVLQKILQLIKLYIQEILQEADSLIQKAIQTKEIEFYRFSEVGDVEILITTISFDSTMELNLEASIFENVTISKVVIKKKPVNIKKITRQLIKRYCQKIKKEIHDLTIDCDLEQIFHTPINIIISTLEAYNDTITKDKRTYMKDLSKRIKKINQSSVSNNNFFKILGNPVVKAYLKSSSALIPALIFGLISPSPPNLQVPQFGISTASDSTNLNAVASLNLSPPDITAEVSFLETFRKIGLENGIESNNASFTNNGPTLPTLTYTGNNKNESKLWNNTDALGVVDGLKIPKNLKSALMKTPNPMLYAWQTTEGEGYQVNENNTIKNKIFQYDETDTTNVTLPLISVWSWWCEKLIDIIVDNYHDNVEYLDSNHDYIIEQIMEKNIETESTVVTTVLEQLYSKLEDMDIILNSKNK